MKLCDYGPANIISSLESLIEEERTGRILATIVYPIFDCHCSNIQIDFMVIQVIRIYSCQSAEL